MALESSQILILYGETMTQTAKTGPARLGLLFVLFLVLIAASCASTGGHDKKLGESLKLSVDAFNDAFRFEEYTEAAAFVPADKKERFWAEVDGFKGKIRIADFDVREVEHKDKSTSANPILYFQFWRLDSPILQTVTLTQKWYFDQKDKQWKVSDSGFGAITRTRAGF